MIHASLVQTRRPAIRRLLGLSVTLFVLGIAGCAKPVEKTEVIRPVRVTQAGTENSGVLADLSGEVRARIESRLGFRVGGKVVARKVDVGSLVKRGQPLLQLDPQDLQLAQAQANAGLKAAESSRDLARAEYKRYQDLREKNFVSQAVLDAKETAFRAAQASYEQAVAAFKNQSNQAGYATLTADIDGVVTAIDAEIGQVVAAGAPVVKVARLDEKEIAVGIPEGKVDSLRQADGIKVTLWADPDHPITGKIREISPVADTATRTYAARIAIPASAEARLGMTASVSFSAKTPNALIRLPLTALFQEKSSTAVWLVQNGAVQLKPVRIAGTTDNDVLVAEGIAPGDVVVTAGANRLSQGQKVTILGEELPATASNTFAAETAQ